MARKATTGDTVSVHYTGRLNDGRVFDSSREGDPLEFQLGSGQVIPGFEKAVEGLEIGEQTETRIPPQEAYGERRDELLTKVERERLPEEIEPAVGQQLAVQVGGGQQQAARIAAVDEQTVTLDLNHPLAGEDLTFELELVAIA